MESDASLEKELRVACRFARIGSILLSIFVLLSLFISFVILYASLCIGITEETPPTYWIINIFGSLALVLAYLLPARFLHLFATGVSPYDKSQMQRLTISGALFVLNWILGYAPGPSEDILVATSPIPLALGHAQQPSLFTLAIGIFIICVAGTMRYAAALKEDSDSIL